MEAVTPEDHALITEFRDQNLPTILKYAPNFYGVISAATCIYHETMLAGARKWEKAGRPK